MFNPEFSIFNDWMFGKLSDLLSGVNPPSGEKWEKDPQLYVYARGVKEKSQFGKLPVRGSLYYFELVKPRSPTGVWKTKEFDEKTVADFFDNEIKPLIERILNEDFKPDPESFKCGRCSYLDICDAGQSL